MATSELIGKSKKIISENKRKIKIRKFKLFLIK